MSRLKISDFNISGEPIPEDVADKILINHLLPGSKVQEKMGILVWVSKRSGYRPLWWEKKKNRPATSQHMFLGKGAVDWTCENFQENKEAFLEALIIETEYTRFAVYPAFIHCDYALSDERWVFDSNWVRMRKIPPDGKTSKSEII